MRRKKQFLMAALCAFSMIINSVAVVAQSKDKKQEPKSTTQQAPEPPTFDFLIDGPPPERNFLFGFATSAQDVAYAGPQVEFISHEFNFDGKVVKDAPYSADAVTETIQTLGDGNRIVRNSSSKIYRDSAGRTRREQAMKVVGPWAVSGEAPIMITINDPVSGVYYNLNSSSKTAHKMMGLRAFDMSEDSKASAELKAKMKDKLKLRAANGAEAGGGAGVVNEVVIRGGANTGDLTITRSGMGAGAAPGAVVSSVAAGVPMTVGSGVFSWTSEAEVNQEPLGTQAIEGVMAEGTRVTFTIPAGKIGNERPIVTVNERWYSQELQTVVLTKNSDPRMGETTYRLTNINRSEPDPSLFQVPADYTVDEGVGPRLLPPEPLRKLDLEKKLEMERRTKRPNEN
jgi:hypothetical protein